MASVPQIHEAQKLIVIIDDCPMVRDLIAIYTRGWLDGQGWADTALRLFQDGEAAWQEISQTDPEVLITDMQRPGSMSGWEMLPLLAERNVKYPILLVTGYGEQSDSLDGKTLRDVHNLLRSACSNLDVTIVPKPFPLESLRKALQQALKDQAPESTAH
jgi:CheY-like chemotaxis protein